MLTHAAQCLFSKYPFTCWFKDIKHILVDPGWPIKGSQGAPQAKRLWGSLSSPVMTATAQKDTYILEAWTATSLQSPDHSSTIHEGTSLTSYSSHSTAPVLRNPSPTRGLPNPGSVFHSRSLSFAAVLPPHSPCPS